MACFALYALAWVSVTQLDRLKDIVVQEPDGGWPKVSVVVPACNEADTLDAAMASLLACDYPNLEIVLVNDRSTDQTGHIMDGLSERDQRVHVVHIDHLPAGWLGKLNAMHQGTQRALGQLLLFTDADVHFEPSSIRRAVSELERCELDHLTAMPRLKTHDFVYNIALCSFALLFMMGVRAWRFRNPDSNAYAGVGAFALVRKATFDKTPGWSWLKMEVADDVGLGMLMVREAQGRSKLFMGTESIQVDWYSGLRAMVIGLEKNIFGATCGYSVAKAFILTLVFTSFAFSLPMLIVGAASVASALTPVYILSLAVLLTLLVANAIIFRGIGLPLFPALVSPFGYVILAWVLVRSTYTTLKQGGVRWRDSFYPLSELRSGRRIDL